LSTLQLGLIIAGVLLVIGVIVYNHWQERRLKRQTASELPTDMRSTRAAERVEPTLGAGAGAPSAAVRRSAAMPTSKARSSRRST